MSTSRLAGLLALMAWGASPPGRSDPVPRQKGLVPIPADTIGPDSLAAVARGRYREGVRLAEAGNLAEARKRMVEAIAAWPSQVAYPVAAARLSAQLGDTAQAIGWLGAIADLGLSIDLDSRPDLAAVARSAAASQVVVRLRSNGAPWPQSTPIVTDLPADFYPEGADYDSVGNRWLIASIRHRTIASVDSRGRSAPFVAAGAPPLNAVLGVRVDPARGLVWATTRVLPQQGGYQAGTPLVAGVSVFDRRTGKLLASTSLPEDGTPHLLGDLVVGRSGSVYLSDSESPVLYRARYDGGRIAVEEVLRHRYFRSLQGLAFAPSEDRLYLADYSHGLLAVDLPTRTVRYLAAPSGATMLGIDGLAWHRGRLVAIQNGVAPARVIAIELESDGLAIRSVTVLDRHSTMADEPTIGSVAGDRFVYVANSQWEKYDEAGRLRERAVLTAPVLLSLPLGAPR